MLHGSRRIASLGQIVLLLVALRFDFVSCNIIHGSFLSNLDNRCSQTFELHINDRASVRSDFSYEYLAVVAMLPRLERFRPSLPSAILVWPY